MAHLQSDSATAKSATAPAGMRTVPTGIATVMEIEIEKGEATTDEEETATAATMMTGTLLDTTTTNVTAMAGAGETMMTAVVVVEGTMMLGMAAVDVSEGAVAKVHLTGDLPPPKVSCHCRSASERLLVGTSTLQDMSNIPLSRRSRQVGTSLFLSSGPN